MPTEEDGSLYVSVLHQVLRISPDGIVSNFAGRRSIPGFAGDGGLADQALLSNILGIDVAPDGSVYIADWRNRRVRKVDPEGIITTVAGNGQNGFAGDGGPATAAQLGGVRDVAVAPDGNLYVLQAAGTNGSALRRVAPDGVIWPVTLRRACPVGPDKTLPIGKTCLRRPTAISMGPDGSLYVTEGYPGFPNVVRRIDPAGIISLFAGTGAPADGVGDGLPATEARLGYPRGVAVASDGNVYIASGGLSGLNRIRYVADDGIMRTLAGTGGNGFSGDGGPALLAQLQLSNAGDVAVGPDHAVYVAAYTHNRIRRVSNSLPGYTAATDIPLASEDGAELFVFDASGRHLRTVDALTGALIWQFGYDGAGRLVTVTDAYNAVTRIERAADGTAQRIVAPDGQETVLGMDANGYLADMTNPAGEINRFESSGLGLMQAHTTPRGHRSTYEYLPETGRLSRATDPEGQSQSFQRQRLSDLAYEVKRTSTEGRETKYRFEQFRDGRQRRTTTLPDGNPVEVDLAADGSRDILLPFGTRIQSDLVPDPRFGLQAPLEGQVTVTTPGGLSFTQGIGRAVTLSNPDDLLSIETLTQTESIDGRPIELGIGPEDLLSTLTIPRGQYVYRYEHSVPVEIISPQDDTTLRFVQDGGFVTEQQWSGAIAGTVGTTDELPRQTTVGFRAIGP